MLQKIFLQETNFKLLMSVIFTHFIKNYNYQVGADEEELCRKVMHYHVNENKPQRGENHKSYIRRLNKICLSKIIEIITEQLTKQEEDVAEIVEPPQQQLEKDYNNLVNERNPGINKPKNIPNFTEPTTNDNSDIEQKFKAIASIRDKEEQKNVPLSVPIPDDAVDGEKFQTPTNKNKSNTIDTNNVFQNVSDNFSNINEVNAPIASGEQLLIDKPKEFKELADNAYKFNNNYIKTYDLVIDSRDRNIDDYPNNYNYQIDFDYIYKDILSVELVSANIPKSQYLITSTNNTIYFKDNGSAELTASIPIGNYTTTTLATALETAMNTVATNTFTVSVDTTLTNKFTITIDVGTFELLFNGGSETYGLTTRIKYKNNSIGPIIGFQQSDKSGANTYTGDYQYDFNGPTYVLLNITDLENLYGIHNNSITNSFTKIPLDTNNSDTYKFYKSQNDYISKIEFSPPIAKLTQFNIKFLNYNGTFYDFGGLEHTLYFRVTTLNQNQNYFF
jgi:hypothetical protein